MKWSGYALSTVAFVSCSVWAQQYPKPTPTMQAIIDKDNSRHFGDSPVDAGPIATDLSPALNPAAVDKAIRKVADWELERSQKYFDRIWTWSVLYSGFMAATEATGNTKYRDAMLQMGKGFDWKLRSDLPNADDLSIAQTYTELYLQFHDAAMIESAKQQMELLLPLKTLKPNDTRLPWWWCDALFMAPPVWARMYAVTGNKAYISYLDEQWQKTSDLLYDPQEHLYFRDASYLKKTEPNGKKMFWSRGNGWVMGGIVRTLEYLPKDDVRRRFYVTQLQQMAARVAQLQGKDGLWHAGLLDEQTYPMPEVSGSALFAYAMAWGINHGVLERKQYGAVVARAWKGMLQHVYSDGRVGSIQQTGAEPAFYLPTTSYNYGVGAFLLAGSQIKQMAKAGK